MDDRGLEFGHFSRSTAANVQPRLLCRMVVGVEGKRAFGLGKGCACCCAGQSEPRSNNRCLPLG